MINNIESFQKFGKDQMEAATATQNTPQPPKNSSQAARTAAAAGRSSAVAAEAVRAASAPAFTSKEEPHVRP